MAFNPIRHIMRTFRWDKLSIWEIRGQAISSLFKDENGELKPKWLVNFYYEFVPFIIASIILIFGFFITSEVSNYLITGVSIFAGLFFNLLLVIADKLKTRREVLENNKSESKENYLTRFETFSSQFVSIISYAIIQSIWLILLMLLCRVHNYNEVYSKFEIMFYVIWLLTYLFNFLAVVLGFKLIILLMSILSSMYIMIFDDLSLNRKKNNF